MNDKRGSTLSHMASIEIEGGDWPLVAKVIRAEAPHRGFTLDQIAKRAGKDRTHISRMAKGTAVSLDTLRAFNGALGLPRDFLVYVARHDLASIATADAEPDLARWLTASIVTTQSGSNAS